MEMYSDNVTSVLQPAISACRAGHSKVQKPVNQTIIIVIHQKKDKKTILLLSTIKQHTDHLSVCLCACLSSCLLCLFIFLSWCPSLCCLSLFLSLLHSLLLQLYDVTLILFCVDTICIYRIVMIYNHIPRCGLKWFRNTLSGLMNEME